MQNDYHDWKKLFAEKFGYNIYRQLKSHEYKNIANDLIEFIENICASQASEVQKVIFMAEREIRQNAIKQIEARLRAIKQK